MGVSPFVFGGAFFAALIAMSVATSAAPVKVRYPEGSIHGYLALRSLDGKLLASGDLIQTVSGAKLTSRLVYRFKDGSIDDETAVFTQAGCFRLLRDHLVQKGPSFPEATDVTIEAKTGEVTVRQVQDGKVKVNSSHMDLPPDLANGIILVLIKNLPPQEVESKLSYLAVTPKPRIVHLSIKKDGTDSFTSAELRNTAQRFRIHVELGGLAAIVAPMIGKEPADSLAWISGKQVPAFIKSESPLYVGGPLLRTELVGPVWK
jgi:molybdopterin-binding protein